MCVSVRTRTENHPNYSWVIKATLVGSISSCVGATWISTQPIPSLSFAYWCLKVTASSTQREPSTNINQIIISISFYLSATCIITGYKVFACCQEREREKAPGGCLWKLKPQRPTDTNQHGSKDAPTCNQSYRWQPIAQNTTART